MIHSEFRKWLSVGTGIGIEVRGDDLLVTVARVRPQAVQVVAATTITGFHHRPAGEWGSEYAAFLKSAGAAHLTATVLLPRSEVIVRQLEIPGVKDRDLESAISFQVDSLHPYAEEEVAYGYDRIAGSSSVLIGLARVELIERYVLLFAEAGIRVSTFTFSADVLYTAFRMLSTPPEGGFLVLEQQGDGFEAYGESEAKPVFSATFDLPEERVTGLALAELRLDSEAEPRRLIDLLPIPRSNPSGWDMSLYGLSYATALAGACPWLSLKTNLLPAENRSRSSRAVYAPTVALAAMLLISVVTLAVYSGIRKRQYLETLQTEIGRYTSQASEVQTTIDATQALLARRTLIDDFRRRTTRDLDAMRELTRILPPPIWLKQMQLTRTQLVLNGEAPQAAQLLELIDDSPLFRNSEFTSPISKAGGNDSFNIRVRRESPAEGDAQ